MDDFTLSNLYESRNEWSARLISILKQKGVLSLEYEASVLYHLCVENYYLLSKRTTMISKNIIKTKTHKACFHSQLAICL